MLCRLFLGKEFMFSNIKVKVFFEVLGFWKCRKLRGRCLLYVYYRNECVSEYINKYKIIN